LKPLHPLQRPCTLLFDIDGVIRDVSQSYRAALAETVHHYSGWRPNTAIIDALKSEGRWNNDWEASLELLRRHGYEPLPTLSELTAVFSGFYFGHGAGTQPTTWRGFIREEALLVERSFFQQLSAAGLLWGFVSGAEPLSARFVLEDRLGLDRPLLIAMGDAPDKPDPTGLIHLAETLIASQGVASETPLVAYLGDTVADVLTVLAARERQPSIRWLSLAVAPPHLHHDAAARLAYEQRLKRVGADRILPSTASLLDDPELTDR